MAPAAQRHWLEEPARSTTLFGAAHGFDTPSVFGNSGPSLYTNIALRSANQSGQGVAMFRV